MSGADGRSAMAIDALCGATALAFSAPSATSPRPAVSGRPDGIPQSPEWSPSVRPCASMNSGGRAIALLAAQDSSEVVLVALGRHRGLVAHRIARVGVGARWRELGVRGDQVEHHERAYLLATLRGDACIRLEWGARERTVHLLQPGGPPAPGYRREAISELDAAASIGAAPGVFLIPQTEGAGWVTCPAGYR